MWWSPKNFRESLMPLIMIYTIMGHGVFHYPIGKRHPKFSVIYAITITSLYCIALGFTLHFSFNSTWYGNPERIIFWIVYTNITIAGINQVLSWYHRRMCIRVVERISKIDETLQQLGATFDYNGTFNLGIAFIVIWLIVIFCLNAIDVLWLLNVIPVYQNIIIVSVLRHPFHLNFMVAFDFSMAVRLIGIRYRKANDLLEKIATSFEQPMTNQVSQYFENKINISRYAMSSRQFFNGTRNREDVVQIIKQVHLELNSISKDLNRVYGVQIALEITAYFVMCTGHLYNMYTYIMNPALNRRYERIFVLTVWCCTYLAKLMLINHACEDISTEADRTGNIIYAMEGSIENSKLSDLVSQFSLQIIHDRLVFSPAGLFALGFKFVLRFLGTLTTYLVILIDISGESVDEIIENRTLHSLHM